MLLEQQQLQQELLIYAQLLLPTAADCLEFWARHRMPVVKYFDISYQECQITNTRPTACVVQGPRWQLLSWFRPASHQLPTLLSMLSKVVMHGGLRICAQIAQEASVQHVTLHCLQNPAGLALDYHEFELSEVAAAAADVSIV